MPTLLCFGLGYSAEHFVATYGDGFERIIGTVRSAERAAVLSEHLAGRLKALVFDGTFATPKVRAAIDHADVVLVSVPPDENGDPVLRAFGDALAHAPHLRSIVYLSTIGVYGDHAGAWIDEDTPAHPMSERSRERLAAERAWQALGARRGIKVAILRLAGIYGPGQNALIQLVRGTARRIAKPGQVFNRIHVADIAQSIDAAFARNAAGDFNVTDDEPTPTGDPIVFAAHLLGKEPPPEIPVDEAAKAMSPMALSFWGECKRVRNDRLKRQLGVSLQYPTYREGLRALFDAGDHQKLR
jgi:nucleoside-diphosphate-sugar epimerase